LALAGVVLVLVLWLLVLVLTYSEELWETVRNTKQFEPLQLLFEKVFSAPATSAAVELVFSSGLPDHRRLPQINRKSPQITP